MITDVQISEKSDSKVEEMVNAEIGQGTSTKIHQQVTKQSDYQKYKTRIVSTANQVNLTFPKARCVLEAKLVKTIAGIF